MAAGAGVVVATGGGNNWGNNRGSSGSCGSDGINDGRSS